ncbi:MAG: hypothetical protein KDN22_14135 [Verrucomicrobiae bacterium]|nr:hypothetical protein [Verrucomicrobiae bacterium]
MQLSAYLVNWNIACDLAKDEDFVDKVLEEEVPEMYGPECPWDSDSCIQYSAISDTLHQLKGEFGEPTESALSSLRETLFNEDIIFPEELGLPVDPEVVAGSVRPDSCIKIFEAFESIDYDQLEKIFGDLPSALRDNYAEMAPYFAEYIRQWHGLFRLAKEHECGVFMHLG